MNLGRYLTHAAQKWPSQDALVFEGRRWTYAEWNRDVNRAAHAFRARGIGKGDRVATLTYNLPEQVTAFLALLKLGAVPVPINWRLAANEVKYIVDDSGARLLLFEEALRDRVAPIRKDLASVEGLLYVGSRPEGDEIAVRRVHPARIARRARCRGRPRRPGVHHVHLRHHGPAQGRRPHAPGGDLRQPQHDRGVRLPPRGRDDRQLAALPHRAAPAPVHPVRPDRRHQRAHPGFRRGGDAPGLPGRARHRAARRAHPARDARRRRLLEVRPRCPPRRILRRPDAGRRRDAQVPGPLPRLLRQHLRLDGSAHGDGVRLHAASRQARQRRQGVDQHGGAARRPRTR